VTGSARHTNGGFASSPEHAATEPTSVKLSQTRAGSDDICPKISDCERFDQANDGGAQTCRIREVEARLYTPDKEIPMYRRPLASLAFFVALTAPTTAWAHVSIASGPAFADTTGEVTFAVGHGCEGSDTYRVDVEIPGGVTSVRPETSDFGDVNVMTDDAGTIVMVSWQKPDQDVQPKDTQYYKLHIRLKPPAAPFSTLYFPAHQTCKAEDGTLTVVDWVGLDEAESDVEPAPVLHLLPPRFPGWNKFAVPARVDDLAGFFPEAQIVWLDTAAFSINPTTVELIGQTEGVTLLSTIPAGSEIWVRY